MAKKKEDRCWTGYEPVPGKAPFSKGSCKKEAAPKAAKKKSAAKSAS